MSFNTLEYITSWGSATAEREEGDKRYWGWVLYFVRVFDVLGVSFGQARDVSSSESDIDDAVVEPFVWHRGDEQMA